MINIADIIVIIVVLIATFSGYKKGFIRTGFGILSFFIAIALTFMFHQPVVNMIREDTEIEKWLYDYLYSIDINEHVSGEQIASAEVVGISDSGEKYIDNLPQAIVDMIGLEEFKENAKITVVEKIVDFVVKLFAFIIVYIIAKLILSIVIVILDSIAKLPVIKQFNEVLGLILGAILGFLQVYLICAIITLISSFSMAEGIVYVINNSLFTHGLYNNNLLLQILF